MIIGIDKGHFPLQGAIGFLSETKVNVEYGDLLISKFRKLGHTVIDVTPSIITGVTQSLSERTNVANSYNLDLYISLHANSFSDPQANGTECLYFSEAGRTYATKVSAEISKLGYFNRGAKLRSDLYVLNHTNAVAILVEAFFVSNQADCNRYNANDIANAVCMAIAGQIPVEVVKPTIPVDFDPIGYWESNKDVLEAKFSPWEHYLQFGYKEGRVWTRTKLDKATVIKYLEENL